MDHATKMIANFISLNLQRIEFIHTQELTHDFEGHADTALS